jgi:hypothetical protein
VAYVVKERNCIEGFGGETWRRQLGRPRIRREDSIEVALKIIGSKGLDWIALAQDEEK